MSRLLLPGFRKLPHEVALRSFTEDRARNFQAILSGGIGTSLRVAEPVYVDVGYPPLPLGMVQHRNTAVPMTPNPYRRTLCDGSAPEHAVLIIRYPSVTSLPRSCLHFFLN